MWHVLNVACHFSHVTNANSHSLAKKKSVSSKDLTVFQLAYSQSILALRSLTRGLQFTRKCGLQEVTTKTSLLPRLQVQTLPNATPPVGKIHPFVGEGGQLTYSYRHVNCECQYFALYTLVQLDISMLFNSKLFSSVG